MAELLTGLQEKAEVPDEVVAAGRSLDRFSIPSRYPNGWDTGNPGRYDTEEDSERALRDSAAVLRFCQGLVAR